MPRTPFRTPLEDAIVTPGDVIRGEDGTAGTPVLVRGGNSTGGNNPGGDITLSGGTGEGAGGGGDVLVVGGTAGPTGAGGAVTLQGSNAGLGSGGYIFLTGGAGAGGGERGTVRITNTALEFVESPSVPGGVTAPGRGRVWLRNSSPNVLMFTDDAGTNFDLSATAAGLAPTLVAGNTTGGTDIEVTNGDAIDFHDGLLVRGTVDYSGDDIRLRTFTAAGAAAGTLTLDAAASLFMTWTGSLSLNHALAQIHVADGLGSSDVVMRKAATGSSRLSMQVGTTTRFQVLHHPTTLDVSLDHYNATPTLVARTLYEPSGDWTFPTVVTVDAVTYTGTDGNANDVLVTDGLGNTSFVSLSTLPAPPLDAVLVAGNTTGGTRLRVTGGDAVDLDDGTLVRGSLDYSSDDVRLQTFNSGGTLAGTLAIDTIDGTVEVSGSGRVVATDSTADAEDKAGRFGTRRYLDATVQPFDALVAHTTPTTNIVDIGGGQGDAHAATEVRIYAAANNTTLTGTLLVTNSTEADLWLRRGDAIAFVGDGTSSPQFIRAKSDAGFYTDWWYSGGIASTNRRWALSFNATSQSLSWLRHDGSGASLDTPLDLSWATGEATFAHDVTVDEVTYTGTDGNANDVLVTDGLGNTSFVDVDSIVTTPPLDAVLVAGNTTGGSRLEVSSGDAIDFHDGTLVRGTVDYSGDDIRLQTFTAAGALAGTLTLDAAANPFMSWTGSLSLNHALAQAYIGNNGGSSDVVQRKAAGGENRLSMQVANVTRFQINQIATTQDVEFRQSDGASVLLATTVYEQSGDWTFPTVVTVDEVTYTGTDGDANDVLVTDGLGNTSFVDVDSIVTTPALDAVLVAGNTTGGTDIIVSNGDAILGEPAGDVTVQSGAGVTTEDGGTLFLAGGDGGTTSGAGGAITITGGTANGASAGGEILIRGGVGGTTGNGGGVSLFGRSGGPTSGDGGGVAITAGNATNGTAGSVVLTPGVAAVGTDGTVDVVGDLTVSGDAAFVNAVTVGNGLTVSAGAVSLPAGSISYAEIQDVSAEARVLGRAVGAGAGTIQELDADQIGAILDASTEFVRRDGTTELTGNWDVGDFGVTAQVLTATFAASSPVFGVHDGTVDRALVDINSNNLRVRTYDTDGTTLRGTFTLDAATSSGGPLMSWSGRAVLGGTGNFTFGLGDESAATTVLYRVASTTTAGGNLGIRAGYSTFAGGAGGLLSLEGGRPAEGNGGGVSVTGAAGVTATAENRNGGTVTVTAGGAALGGTGGSVLVNGGHGGTTGVAGTVVITAGNGGSTDGTGAQATLRGGAGSGSGNGGVAVCRGGAAGPTGIGGTSLLEGGAGGGTSGSGGSVAIRGGVPTDGVGGTIAITGSNGVGTNRSGGAVIITGGDATGSGTGGNVAVTAGTSPSGTAGTISCTVGGAEAVRMSSSVPFWVRGGSPVSIFGDGTGSPIVGYAKLGTEQILFNYTIDGTGDGARRWIHQFDASENLNWLRRDASGNAVDTPLSLNWTTGEGSFGGAVNVAGQVRSTDSLRLFERAAAPTSAATFGYFWVRDDAPNVPMFTDGAGSDHVLLGTTGAGVDDRIVRWDGTSALQTSAATLDDSGNLSGIGTLNVSGLATLAGDIAGSAGTITTADRIRHTSAGVYTGSPSGACIIVDSTLAQQAIQVIKAAAANRTILDLFDGSNRAWIVQNSSSNALNILRYVAGTSVDTPFSISNSTGQVTLANQLNGAGAVFSGNVTTGAIISNGTIAMDKSDAGAINLAWRVAGTTRWFTNFDASENLNWLRRDATGGAVDTPLALNWSTGVVTTGALTVTGALNANATTVSFNNAVLMRIGDGVTAGNPEMRCAKTDTSTFTEGWYTGGTASANRRWAGPVFATDESLLWQRYDSDGVLVDTPLALNWSTGQVTLANQLNGTSAVFSGTLQATQGRFTTGGSSGIFGTAPSVGSIIPSVGGAADDYVQLGTTTAGRTEALSVYVIDGSRNSRAGMYLADDVSGSGAWGHWLTWSSAGAQPYVLGAGGTEWMRISTSGNAGFSGTLSVGNLTTPMSSARLVSIGSTWQFVLADNATDATTKIGHVALLHHTNSTEEPVTLFRCASASLSTVLSIGGSHPFSNAATQISLYTAADNVTTQGTERLRIDSSGDVTAFGDLQLDSAGGVLTVGNGTGNGYVAINQDGTATTTFLAVQFGGVNTWRLRTTSPGTMLWSTSSGSNQLSFTQAGDFAVAGDGVFGALTAAPTGSRLFVVGETTQIVLAQNTTDATAKTAIVGAYHYTNAEEPITAFRVEALESSSNVTIGGGSAAGNAATRVSVYTASGTTTTTGTERLRVDSSGLVTAFGSVTLDSTGATLTVDEVTYTGTDGDANDVLVTDGLGNTSFVDVDSIVTTPTLDAVLVAGNTTGGSRLEVSNGDAIDFHDGTLVRGSLDYASNDIRLQTFTAAGAAAGTLTLDASASPFMSWTGSLSLNHALAQIYIGNNGGSSDVVQRKASGGENRLSMQVANVTRFQVTQVATSQDVEFRQYDSGGVLSHTTAYSNSTGMWAFPGDVSLGTAATSTTHTISRVAPTDGDGGGLSFSPANGVGTDRSGGGLSITTGNSTGSAAAGDFTVSGGTGGTTGSGGNVILEGGFGGATSGAGGGITLTGGTGTGASAGGAVLLRGGVAGATGDGGSIDLVGRNGGGTSGDGGDVNVTAGVATSGTHGRFTVTTAGALRFAVDGDGNATLGDGTGDPNIIIDAVEGGGITVPNTSTLAGGYLFLASVDGPNLGWAALAAASGVSGDVNGGTLQLAAGSGFGSGASGDVLILAPVSASGLNGRVSVTTAGGSHHFEATGALTHPVLADPPTPGASTGSFYTRASDGAPMHAYGTTPVITELAAAASWEIPLTLATAEVPFSDGYAGGDGTALSATFGVGSGVTGPIIGFIADSANDTCATWALMLPRNYRGGDLVIDIWLAGDGSASADADFVAAVARQETGSSLVSSFAATVAFTGTTISGTANVTVRATATISGASLDGLQAGDPFRLTIRRLAADSYAGDVVTNHGVMYES